MSVAATPGTAAKETALHLTASVVIRAKNEARFVGETLSAIFHPAALPPVRVVVVDSGSTDGTVEIVKQFPATLIQIRPQDFTYGYALNVGVAEADADVVASLSAHSLPANPDWLRGLLKPFVDSRVAGVYGRQIPRPNATPLEIVGMWLTGLLGHQPRLLEKRPLFSNANGAFRRSLWQEHPFDEHVRGAEDIAWARTMQARGYLIAYEPSGAAYHSHGEPFVTHVRRASHDIPTVIGNLLHLGTGDPRPRHRAQPTVIRPAAKID